MVLTNTLPLQINYTNPEIIGKMAPLFGDGYTMIIFSAVVFGLGMRTVYRYYQERKQGNPDAQHFDMKFFYTAIMAFIAAGLPAMALMPSATATFNSMLPQWGVVMSWAFTALIMYSANAGINAAVKGFEGNTISKFVESGKLDRAIQERIGILSGKSENQETTTKSPE